MVESQGNPGMDVVSTVECYDQAGGRRSGRVNWLALVASLVAWVGLGGSLIGQQVLVDPRLRESDSTDSVQLDPVSTWLQAAGDVASRREPGTLYIQTTEEFDPNDLGLDDSPVKPDAGRAEPPAVDAAPPAGAGPAPGASSASPGDETGMIAPVEPMDVPELDNQKLLESIDLKNAEELLERYPVEGEERAPIKLRVQMIKRGDKQVRHGSYVEFYRDGGKFCEGLYVDGHRHGVWKYWYPDGQLAKVGQYDADRAIGSWYYLRPKELLERVEVYANGIRDGRWLNFAPDGQTVLAVRRFKDGEPSGKWYAWYTPNYKRFEYEFLEGRQHGLAKAWHSNGKLWFEGNYAQGKRDGEWTEWDPNGIVLKKNVWKDGQQIAAQK